MSHSSADKPTLSAVAADAFRRHAKHYESILRRADDLYLQGGDALQKGLALFDLEWPNIKSAQSWVATNASGGGEAAELCNSYPQAAPHVLVVRLDPSTRIQWREVALSVARRIGDRQAEGFHLGHLGLAFKNMGDYRRAINFYLVALDIDRELKNKRGELISLGNIGVAYKNLGELEQAASFIEKSLDIAREIGDKRGEANALINLGVILKERGDIRGAIANYEKGLSIQCEISNVQGQLTARGNLAVAHRLLGHSLKAIDMFHALLKEARSMGEHNIAAETWKNLGALYRSMKSYEQAFEYYNSALEAYRRLNALGGEADVLFDRSQMLAELGRLHEAKSDAAHALEIFGRLKHPKEAETRHQLDAWQSEV